jgi:hypothetical protein
MKEQERKRERIEAGHELVRLGRKRTNLIQRDIVDMLYDDGLTPKRSAGGRAGASGGAGP